MKKNTLYICSYILFFCSMYFFFPLTTTAQGKKDFVVVIDPGHGGHDPGALGRKSKEKNINLSIALKVGRLIKENHTDTRIVYTRSKDVFIPLHTRAEIANNAKADLFISIHTNSVARNKHAVSGTETYTLGLHKTQENLEVAQKENAVILIEEDYQQRYAGFNPNSAESYIIFEFLQDKNMEKSVNMAQFIQREFRQTASRKDKGVHQAGFLVLRATSMPSVLIEVGYISNPNEENYLISERGQNALAKSIYNAFCIYKNGNTATLKTTNTENVVAYDNIEPSLPTETNAPVINETPVINEIAERTPNNSPKILEADSKPVFKIQILTSDKKLGSNSKLFKGVKPVSYYFENNIYKYTYGEDTNYNKILRLKRSIDSKFKDAFIIAFKNGKKMNINQAIREFKKNR